MNREGREDRVDERPPVSVPVGRRRQYRSHEENVDRGDRAVLSRLVALYSNWRAGRSSGESAARFEVASDDGDVGERSRDGFEEGVDGASVPTGVTDGTGTPTGWRDLLRGESVSRQEVQIELGLQPHEFLAWLVRSSGGRMWQADMVETTGWSKSTVSRYLDTLESNDIVERVQIGRRKLVGVPDEMPTGARVPENSPERSSPESSSWSDEAA